MAIHSSLTSAYRLEFMYLPIILHKKKKQKFVVAQLYKSVQFRNKKQVHNKSRYC